MVKQRLKFHQPWPPISQGTVRSSPTTCVGPPTLVVKVVQAAQSSWNHGWTMGEVWINHGPLYRGYIWVIYGLYRGYIWVIWVIYHGLYGLYMVHYMGYIWVIWVINHGLSYVATYNMLGIFGNHYIWLVVSTPPKNISQLG